ncbi:MAG: proline dehydrogenase family protein [Gemmatimonadetes bacterium]|nr:proline dehydrogenase family protein [Gemmatimonadota bacterium]
MMRTVLLRLSRSKFMERQMKRRKFARRAIRKFMPGEEVEAAFRAAQKLGRRGLGVVLTELGENVATPEEAAAVARHYENTLDRLAALAVDGEISVKPTHLGLDLGVDVARNNLERLVRKASQLDNMVWVDMEDSSYVDRTLDLVRAARAIAPNVGVCLQAYLHRTPEDLASLRDPAVRVRLVKGAYREDPEQAIQKKKDVDQRFHELAVSMLRDRDYITHATPVFGTHDDRLIERIRESARQYGASPGQLEFHMLYGIGVELQEWLAAVGARVRVLISYGEHWYPWYMRRLAERPANLWFVVRKAFG